MTTQVYAETTAAATAADHYDPASGAWDGQLPNADLVAQVPPAKPVDLRDRKDGGHLDRTAWAFDFRRRHSLTPLQGYILAYAAFRASAYRQFLFDDSQEQVSEAVGCNPKTAGRALRELVNAGALYQLSSGKGGHSTKASRYRLRGSETGWRVPGLDHEAGNVRLTNIEPETNPEQCSIDASQCSIDDLSMFDSRLFNVRQSNNPPVPPPVTHPVVVASSDDDNKNPPVAVATAESPAAAAALSLSLPESLDSAPTEETPVCSEPDCRQPGIIEWGGPVCVVHAVDAGWWEFLDTGTWTSGIHGAKAYYLKHPEELRALIADYEAEEQAIIDAKEAQQQREADALARAEERERERIAARAAEEAALPPEQLGWRHAVKAMHGLKAGGFNIGAVARDVDTSGVTLADGVLVLPFRNQSNLDRFMGGWGQQRADLLAVVQEHLPGVTDLTIVRPAHDNDCGCLNCRDAMIKAERDKAAEFVRDHVAEWEHDPAVVPQRPGARAIPPKVEGWLPPDHPDRLRKEAQADKQIDNGF